MAKTSAAAELAEKLVQTLRAQRDQLEAEYPLTLTRLVELADPQTSEERAKALKHKHFTGQVVLARKKDADTPLALKEDAERLADSRLLLEWLLERECSPESPALAVDRLAKKVDEPLRNPVARSIERRLKENSLPETVAAVTLKKKPHLYLRRMPPPPPKKAPSLELAEKLIESLRAERERAEQYPLSLQQLLDRVAPDAEKKLVTKALGEAIFQQQAVVAFPKDAASPVALSEDTLRLAGSEALLEYALSRTCTPKKRTVAIEPLKAQMVPALRHSFEVALRLRLSEGTLPEGVGTIQFDGETILYRTSMPPEASLVLAARLMQELRQRHARQEGYPATLGQLVEATQPGASVSLIGRAMADRVFKKQAVLALPRDPQTPVALKGDEHFLASSPLLFEHVLSATRTESNQALPIQDLKKKLNKELQRPFESAVQDDLEGFALPSGIGSLRIKKKVHLFLLRDVSTAAPLPTEEPASVAAPAVVTTPTETPTVEIAAPVDFEAAFDEAFERLDRQKGGVNFVSLVDLRRELPQERVTFDEELRRLRRLGRYTLTPAEGRHGLSEEEQEAALREEGTLLLYVGRRTS